MRRFCIACAALGLSLGCASTDEATTVNPLVVKTEAAAPAGPAALTATTTSAKSKADPSLAGPGDTGSRACSPGLVGISTESGWIGADQEGWNGTGHPDPEPLRKISNEEMLQRATNPGDQREQRWHALVSVGRRKVPGAVDAFKQALDRSNSIQVREMAVNGMMEHGGPQVLSMLWDILENDKSAFLRGKAVWGIAAYTPEEAERAILQGLQDDEVEVAGMALLASWSLKDRPEVLMPILEDAVESGEKRIWQEAASVLMRLPFSEAGNLLERTARASTGDKDKLQSFAWSYRQWRVKFPDLCN